MVEKIIIDTDFIREKDHKKKDRPRRDFGEFEERIERFPRDHMKPPKRRGPRIVETKLFVSKAELVKYVNEKGQSDAIIDIFKIEEELYKMVIKK